MTDRPTDQPTDRPKDGQERVIGKLQFEKILRKRYFKKSVLGFFIQVVTAYFFAYYSMSTTSFCLDLVELSAREVFFGTYIKSHADSINIFE